MSDLASLRQQIDQLDTELLRLLNRRATLAKEIGAIKSRDSLPVYSPDREMKLLRSLEERSEGPLRPESIHAIYREIMSAALALEKDIIIACLGPSGSPSHQSSLRRFGSSVRYCYGTTIADVFEKVSAGEADCGVVPLEDSATGFLPSTLDELANSDLVICAEINSENTSDNSEPHLGVSRFLILGRQPNNPSDHDQSMIMLRIEDKPGALVSALEPFRKLGINLTHFASRPAAKGSNDTLFFVEADGHHGDLQHCGLFNELSRNCRAVKVLGSYPKPRI